MAVYTHAVTGVVVTIDDDTAARLGSEWVKADAKSDKPTTRRRKSDD